MNLRQELRASYNRSKVENSVELREEKLITMLKAVASKGYVSMVVFIDDLVTNKDAPLNAKMAALGRFCDKHNLDLKTSVSASSRKIGW
jgi:hypothetical protein